MAKKYTKEQIYEKICEILIGEFEIEKSKLNKEANLFEDLELDSVDAVDLAVRLQQYSEKRIQPSDFKEIRTMQDVVDAVYNLL